MKDNDILTSSYCVFYEENTFVLGLGNREDDKIDIKGVMMFDSVGFKAFLDSVVESIIKYEKETGKSFLHNGEPTSEEENS